MNFPIVSDYFLPFSVRVELDHGFRVLGAVRAQNVFSFSTRTVELSFLKEQRLTNHSFLQDLEFRGTPEKMKAQKTQDFGDNPWPGLAEERTAMAIPCIRAAFAATQPFPAAFLQLRQRPCYLFAVKDSDFLLYSAVKAVFRRTVFLLPSTWTFI